MQSKSPLLVKSAASFEVEYEFATTQVCYSGEVERDLLDFIHNEIKPEDAYESEFEGIQGKERNPHITLLYGIKERRPDILKFQQLIQNHPALNTVGWLGLGKFESENYDVLIIEITSPECGELFADLNQLYPDNANSYPDYVPHTTLAYLKKGVADKYIKEYAEAFIDPVVPVTRIEFEFNGEVTVFDPNSAEVKKVASEGIKTQKGTPIQRYKPLGVGKSIGGDLYLHRQYTDRLPDQEALQEAMARLPEGYDWNVVKVLKNGAYSFINCADFDTADEPTAGEFVFVAPDGRIRSGVTKSIWHHKWNFVDDDYAGFDVEKSKDRSRKWLAIPGVDSTRIGNPKYWASEVLPQLK